MNSYPFLDIKMRPIFTSELGDITPRVRTERVIDISNSPLVAATSLRRKLEYLHDAGELDGGLPLVRDDILVGLIPAPDLEFALDKLDNEGDTLCLMAGSSPWYYPDDDEEHDPTDLTTYTDPVSTSEEPSGHNFHVAHVLIGSCRIGYSFTNGPCVAMLRETRTSLYLRRKGW